MQSEIFLLSAHPQFPQEFAAQFGDDRPLIHCPTLKALSENMARSTAGIVLVHLEKTTLGGTSPGRFVAELGDCVIHARMVGLVDENCPARLQELAGKLVDRTFELPLTAEQLEEALAENTDLETQLEDFRRHVPHRELVGQTRSLTTFSPEMFSMLDEIKVAGRHDVTALLIGETGSGKTYLAGLIHELSPRCEERLITVACGALPPDLIESELFGHVKGAFTGADSTRQGKFAAAGRGTLLLDEIDVLPLEQQAKLLRVIETGQYEPVGSNETKHSEARLIVASNYNLEDLVAAGTFRSDLYYRLNIITFAVPPLRERPWDVEYMARQFALEHSREHNIPLRNIEPEFIAALKNYDWPGNIREMENVIRRAVLVLPARRAQCKRPAAAHSRSGPRQHGPAQPANPYRSRRAGGAADRLAPPRSRTGRPARHWFLSRFTGGARHPVPSWRHGHANSASPSHAHLWWRVRADHARGARRRARTTNHRRLAQPQQPSPQTNGRRVGHQPSHALQQNEKARNARLEHRTIGGLEPLTRQNLSSHF